jgi:hypothetical protein
MRKSNVRLQSLQFSAPLEGRIFWLRSLFRSNRRPHGLDNLKVTASRLDCIIQSRSHRSMAIDCRERVIASPLRPDRERP